MNIPGLVPHAYHSRKPKDRRELTACRTELTMPTAGNKKKAPAPQISCLTSESTIQLDFLPYKLREKLLPFQKDGIIFALRRDGRCMVADEENINQQSDSSRIWSNNHRCRDFDECAE